jgi:hypothetical protein
MAADGSAYIDRKDEKIDFWDAVSVMDPRQNQLVLPITFLNMCACYATLRLPGTDAVV